MPDPDSDLHQLVRDTLHFLKDPLGPKQTLFSSAEEVAFFRVKAPAAPPPPAAVPFSPAVKRELPERQSLKQKPLPPTPPPAVVEIKASPAKIEPPATDFSDKMKATLQKVLPHLSLVDAIPDDATAKKVSNSWKEKISDAEVILLACQTDEETLELLKSLGKAIDKNLAKAKIIPAERLEKEGKWDLFLQKNPFRLIVASERISKLSGLMSFYTAVPAQSQFFLGKIPLLVLGEAHVYKSIEHKAHLWKTLCQLLKK